MVTETPHAAQTDQPVLALETFFDGHVEAWGVFEDRFGTVRREFFVDIHGDYRDGTLTLQEDFFYSDGETERRVWTISRERDGTYRGSTADSIGEARGAVDGNRLSWAYDFSLRLGGRKVRVHFRDLFLLQPGHTLINRAAVSKWGLKLGEANIFFRRADAAVGDAIADTKMSRVGDAVARSQPEADNDIGLAVAAQ